MGKKNKTYMAVRPNYNQDARRNNAFYWLWYDNLYQLACATLKWEGLPVEIDKRFVSMSLFGSGLVVFYWDDEYDCFFCLRGTPSGEINMYNNPMRFTAYGAGNYHKTLSASECVPIWLNYRRVPILPIIDLYASRLAKFDRAIDVNIAQHMTPAIIECDERQRLTLDNLVSEWQGGAPVILGNDGMLSSIQAKYLTNEAPYLADKIQDAKRDILNEFLTLLGVDNSPVDKAERVQSAEVHSNNQAIETFRLIRLDTVREGCAAINRMFGEKLEQIGAGPVWCDLNTDYSSQNWVTLNTVGEGSENGTQLP